MSKLTVDFSKIKGFTEDAEFEKMSHLTKAAADILEKKEGAGSDF